MSNLLEGWNIVEKNGQTMVWKDATNIESSDIQNAHGMLNATPKYCSRTNSVVFLTDSKVDFRKETNYGELELISRYIEPTQDYTLV